MILTGLMYYKKVNIKKIGKYAYQNMVAMARSQVMTKLKNWNQFVKDAVLSWINRDTVAFN